MGDSAPRIIGREEWRLDMIDKLHVQKSFVLLGRSLTNCLGCGYCRLSDGATDGLTMTTLPSEINQAFRELPVAVNLFHGDPTLQILYTQRLLRMLEHAGHAGPVVVILKGDFRRFPVEDFALDLHFAFSTFGVDHPLDGGSRATFTSNLAEASRRGLHHYSIEYRPIVYGVNDSQETVDWVLDRAAEHGMAVGYSGLQGKPSLVQSWQAQGLPLRPYPGYRFGHKKMISAEVEERIRSSAEKRGAPVFRKTSCLVSYTHGLARDYNAHYYRPGEVGCAGCPMRERCHEYKKNLGSVNTDVIPYPHTVVEKTDHVCVLKRNGTCEFPTDDCSRISGHVIKTPIKLTTADVRVTKWLTGLTVDADFVENPQLSDFWNSHAGHLDQPAGNPNVDAASVFTKEELDDLRNGTNRGYIDARDSYMRRTGCSIECAEAAIARWRSVENT